MESRRYVAGKERVSNQTFETGIIFESILSRQNFWLQSITFSSAIMNQLGHRFGEEVLNKLVEVLYELLGGL